MAVLTGPLLKHVLTSSDVEYVEADGRCYIDLEYRSTDNDLVQELHRLNTSKSPASDWMNDDSLISGQ